VSAEHTFLRATHPTLNPSTFFPRALAGCLYALSAGCPQPGNTNASSSSSGQQVTSSSQQPVSSSGAGDAGVPECVHLRAQDLDPVVFDLQDDVSTGYSMRLNVNLGSPVPDYFVLKFFNYNERTEMPTGTFPLGEGMNENTGGCAECLNVFVDQLTANSAPAMLLFQSAGSITLLHDPRDTILRGSVQGLTLVEVTLDPETQASEPVPGGLCVTVEDLTWDFHFVPEAWTCDPGYYNNSDDCDCGCGAPDPDCSPAFGEPPPFRGCDADEQCVIDRCLKTCSTAAPTQACAAGVCALGVPLDVCDTDPAVVDPAPLGGTCTLGYPALVCGVLNGIQRGACDVEDQTCRPVCASHTDCAVNAQCAQLVFGADLSWKGYCAPGAPYEWQCEPARWRDGTTCDCGCGMMDADCENAALPVAGCDGGMCGTDGLCGP